MKAQIAFTLCVFVLGTTLAQAQAPSAAFNVAGPTGGAVVKDAPYSAEVVTTYDRVLPSGEKLHGETHGKVYRDSQGRTRTESDALAPATTSQKFMFIFINDPIDHSVIMLDPRTMTARVNPWPFPAVGAPGATTRLVAPLTPLPDAKPGSPAAATSGVPPSAASVITGSSSNAMQTEDLGTREIEGVSATGMRTTRTLAPAVGDTQPRIMVTTTWVSPDLKVAVLTETEDAQTGHRATRLVKVTRTEPDAGLFQIPSGYTVADNRPQQ
jgi:hypothetical protein